MSPVCKMVHELGWIAAPASFLLFSFIIYYVSGILVQCHKTFGPVSTKHNYTYMDVVVSNLGGSKVKSCGLIQYKNLMSDTIKYIITASRSMMVAKCSNYFHTIREKDLLDIFSYLCTIICRVAEIIFLQMTDFSQMSWLSTVMSFAYDTTKMGFGTTQVAGRGKTKTNLITTTSTGTAIRPQNIWESFQALGDIAFAYSYSVILIEIQDMITRPPPEAKTMKKASLASLTITYVFYMICGYMGYSALEHPHWLLDFANVTILVYCIGAYQVDCHPIFAFVEKWAAQKCPKMDFITKDIEVPIAGYDSYNLNLFRLICQTTFVVLTTILPKFLPFFDDIVRILGAFGFQPLTVYLPMEMYIGYKRRYLSRVQDGFTIKPLAMLVLKYLSQLLQDRSRVSSFISRCTSSSKQPIAHGIPSII